MFDAVVNPYGGCYIAPEQLPASAAEFSDRLAQSIDAWRALYRLCWLELPAQRSDLVPYAVALGFEFHHCQPELLMLVIKLQPDAYLPLAATHSIGVGAVVLSPAGRVLLVQEKPLPGKAAGYFKLPGGMVDAKEHLAEAVVREVREETGIEARFDSMLALRHHHQGQFGASNIYFVCRLYAEEKTPVADPNEILQVRWFDIDAYLQDDKANPYNKLLLKTALKGVVLHPHKIAGYMQSPEAYEIFSALTPEG
ncbi:NUDIX domain-containing protein [Rheinheimera marina]|uniref:NUDIX domain-containing protein n=1 Tax=Rheinheimera marina TaxID=1774958 RepID=A0ABV9JQ29_9GAMM